MPNLRRLAALAALLAGLAATSLPAYAQLTVQITRGVTTPIPVAVVPFGGAGPLPVDAAQVIGADLERSGRFQALPRASMLQKPSRAGDLDFAQWRLLKTDFVVIGRVVPNGERLAVEFELYNVVTGERLLGYSVPAASGSLRLAAHRAADMIYEKILGVPGAFATRIAYVSLEGAAAGRHWRLIVADADGENPKTVVESPEPIMSPAWSPDGTRLAYVSFEGRMSSVYVQSLATGARERVSARAGINGAPAWSPDGKRLALTLSQSDGNVDIFVLDLSSRALLRVTDDPAIDTEPCWAPDGRSLYLHLRPRRPAADLPDRARCRRAAEADHLRGRLQRAAAGLARRHAARDRHPRPGRLPDRRGRHRLGTLARAVLRAPRRGAVVRAERPDRDLRGARGRPRRARDRRDRRQRHEPDQLGHGRCARAGLVAARRRAVSRRRHAGLWQNAAVAADWICKILFSCFMEL